MDIFIDDVYLSKRSPYRRKQSTKSSIFSKVDI